MVCNAIRIFGSRVLDTTIPLTHILTLHQENISVRKGEAGPYIQAQMLHDGK